MLGLYDCQLEILLRTPASCAYRKRGATLLGYIIYELCVPGTYVGSWHALVQWPRQRSQTLLLCRNCAARVSYRSRLVYADNMRGGGLIRSHRAKAALSSDTLFCSLALSLSHMHYLRSVGNGEVKRALVFFQGGGHARSHSSRCNLSVDVGIAIILWAQLYLHLSGGEFRNVWNFERGISLKPSNSKAKQGDSCFYWWAHQDWFDFSQLYPTLMRFTLSLEESSSSIIIIEHTWNFDESHAFRLDQLI